MTTTDGRQKLPSLPGNGRDSLLDDLAREENRSHGASRIAAMVTLNGVLQEAKGPQAIERALTSRPARTPQQALGPHGAFGMILDDTATFNIRRAASLVLSYDSKFGFKSYTEIDSTRTARFTFTGDRKVSAGPPPGGVTVFSATESQSIVASGGSATATWPDFYITSGCAFTGTLATRHKVEYPWGFVVMSNAVKTRDANSGGSNAITRDCGTAPPPPPSNSEPRCDDASGNGCSSSGSGGALSGGFPLTREIGRTGSYKTVCWVTDWYENGVFVETTYDRCWTEPIW